MIRWDMIEAVKVTADHAFFFFAQRAALILPRRPFPSDADFKDFLKLARRFHEGLESVSEPQPESFSSHPTHDAESGSKSRRELEAASELRVDEERTAAGRDLSFVLTVEDHIAFHTLLFQRLPFWRRHFTVVVMWVIFPIFMAHLFYSVPFTPRISLLLQVLIRLFVTLAPLGLIVLGSWWIVRQQATKRAQAVRRLLTHPQNQKLVGETTIRITLKEVISKTMTGTSSIRWEKIDEIVVTADHAFFFYAERAALIIPKRPRQAEEFDEFVELARKYQEGTADDSEISATPPEERIAPPNDFGGPRNVRGEP